MKSAVKKALNNYFEKISNNRKLFMCNNMCMHFSFMCNLHVNVRNYSGCTRLYRLYRLVVSNMNETTCEKQHFFAFANNKQHMRRLWVDGFEPVPTRADHENI